MRRRRVVVVSACGALALLTACGAKHPPPADVDETGGDGGAATGGAATAGETSGGATAGTGNSASGGGPAGGVESGGGTAGGVESGGGTGGGEEGGAGTGTGGVLIAECGNGIAELSEQCDGNDFGTWSCRTLGFDEGKLVCDDCEIDYSDCSGTEACFDFRDNDGDRAVDCDDTECADACADPCGNAPELDDPAIVEGTTVGRASELEPSCNNQGEPTGPEVVYQFTAAHSGIIDVRLNSSENLTVSLRTTCDDLDTELECAFGRDLERSVTEGERVFVIVDGLESSTAGAFTLEVASRAIECGDGFRDGDEGCDDGNLVDDDGCSAACEIEPTESADNDTLADADAYVDPFFANISPVGDEDWIEFAIDAAPASVALDTFDLGDGACSSQDLDSALKLYDADGYQLEEDDDGGAGYCAHIAMGDLPAGTYYVRVLASPALPAGARATFPYRLSIDVDSCGNGRQAEAEECDDGNRINWDGCNSECKLE